MSKSDGSKKTWDILARARRVAGESSRVRIDAGAVNQAARDICDRAITVPAWDTFCHYGGEPEKRVGYLLILDSINFCFWPASGHDKWRIEYQSRVLSGYFALAASLKRAIEGGIPITSADYLERLSCDQFNEIVSGRGELQLVEQRVRILNDVGRILLTHYSGNAYRLVETSGNSAVDLVLRVAEEFPSFQDAAEYEGGRVPVLKRAQIFAADLYGAFGGKDWGFFFDMERLTAFADYKLPQVLRQLGVLEYGSDLAAKVDNRILLPSGSPEEVEIRANTLWAVELIRQELEQRGKKLRAFELDWILWNMSKQEQYQKRPHHRTVTIFY
ncbi:MAG: queuosine salvage family protein [Deltaproteobacteria bacterium]|nr:queuosine salvage family protein [Deltaproteobacteria bacterium]